MTELDVMNAWVDTSLISNICWRKYSDLPNALMVVNPLIVS